MTSTLIAKVSRPVLRAISVIVCTIRWIPTRERTNLLLAGSTVATGRGEGLVFATGSETEFGQVAHLTASTARSVSTLEVQIQRIVHPHRQALGAGHTRLGQELGLQAWRCPLRLLRRRERWAGGGGGPESGIVGFLAIGSCTLGWFSLLGLV